MMEIKDIQGVPVDVIPLHLGDALKHQTILAPAGGGMSIMANNSLAETQDDKRSNFYIIETGSSWKALKKYFKTE